MGSERQAGLECGREPRGPGLGAAHPEWAEREEVTEVGHWGAGLVCHVL